MLNCPTFLYNYFRQLIRVLLGLSPIEVLGDNMKLEKVKLPPVSTSFFEELQKAFPKLDPRDIKADTDMIQIQRNAAQQEIIEYIRPFVKPDGGKPEKKTLWNRITGD